MRSARVVVLTAMVPELRPVARALGLERVRAAPDRRYVGRVGATEVVATLTSMGTEAARRKTDEMLDEGETRHVVMAGIAGAVDDRLAIGAVVVPEVVVDEEGRELRPHSGLGRHRAGRLLTTDVLYNQPADLERMREAGIVAVDMETAAVAAVCEERGIPWSAVRAISDRAGDPETDESVVGLARADGSANPGAVARWLVRNPLKVGHLVRLGRGMKRATRAAATTTAAAVPEL